VCEDFKKRRTNLAVAWVDFKKAFDSVPHPWLLEVLQMYKFSPALIHFLSVSMMLWNTNLTIGGNFMANIHIKCGIFQGDCLSPLLFCIALNPLSELIKDTSYGYKLKCNLLVQHLLYMDDLKLYAKNEKEIDYYLEQF